MASDPPRDDDGSVLREYLSVLRVRKWSIIAIVVLAVAGSLAFAVRRDASYQAAARVQATNPTATITSSNPVVIQPNMPTEQALVGSQTVTDCAWVIFEADGGMARKLCGDAADAMTSAFTDASPEPWFRDGLSVSVPEGTTILAVAYTADLKHEAQRGANAFADAYIWWKTIEAEDKVEELRTPLLAQQSDLQAQITELNTSLIDAAAAGDSETVAALQTQLNALYNSLQVVNQQLIQTSPVKIEPPTMVATASLPTNPVGPNLMVIGFIALFAGLAFGVAQAFVREQLDDRLRGRGDLEQRVGAPVLAVVPKVPWWRKRRESHLVSVEEPKGAVAESYRTLRTSVLFAAAQHGFRSVMVVSAMDGEGKTTTAANLAVVLADAGKDVIVLSCDLRKPRIHEFFGLPGGVGLSSVLAGEVSASDALLTTSRPHLRVMASGPTPGSPAELLQSEQMGRLMEELLGMCDFLILDTPPVVLVADALALAPLVDSVIFVADAQMTSRGAIAQAREQLQQLDAPVIGAVLNDFDPSKARTYAGRYGYYGSYGSDYYGRDREQKERPTVELVDPDREAREGS